MFQPAHLQGTTPADASAISFPPSTAQHAVLPNGLTVIVQEDHSAPLASVQVWCAAGSIFEDKHLGSGLSHILEHMLFKGTATRTTNEIAQKIQDVGGYVNAYTSFDRTVFWIDLPKDGVSTALDILADAMMNSTLPAEEYTREQEVIRREFAMGQDDPDRVVSQLLFATAYQHHPYRLPVIGLLDIYNQLTQEQVMEYYRARYVPNNLTFVIVGDIETAQVHDQLESFFADYPGRSLSPLYIPPEPPQLGRREIEKEFASELTHLAMAWHVPDITSPDVPALDVLSLILGEGRSSRLYRRVREEAALAFSIEAFSYTPGEPGLLGIDATLAPGQRKEALDLIERIVADVREHGVRPEELAKARKIALAHELGSLTTMRGQASDLGTNWFLTRNLNFSREYLRKIQAVSAAEVQNAAAKYLVNPNLTVVSLNPRDSKPLARRKNSALAIPEIEQFELANGLRVLVREDRRLPLVSMAAVFRGGLLTETAQTNGLTRLVTKALLKGTTSRTADQISGELESVGGEIGADAGNNSFAVRVGVTRPDFALGLDVLADVLLNATFPEKEVAREKEVRLARIKEEDEELTSVARNLVRATLFGDHPFGLPPEGSSESVGRLSPELLRQYRDRYLVARNGVLAVFGDVKTTEVKAQLEEKLGRMTSGQLALTQPPVPSPFRRNRSVEAARDKAQAVLMVGFRSADIFDPDHYALALLDEASSDLGSRFFVRIREQMGLAYFVGAAQMQGLVPGMFAFYLGTDPKKVPQVKAAFLEEIAKLANEGLTEAELARAKKKLIGQQQIGHQSNDMFAYMASLDELYGLGWARYREVPARVNAVSLAEIKRVAARYFSEQSHVLAIVRPPPARPATKMS